MIYVKSPKNKTKQKMSPVDPFISLKLANIWSEMAVMEECSLTDRASYGHLVIRKDIGSIEMCVGVWMNT